MSKPLPPRTPSRRLWLAAGALLSNAEDPKYVPTKTAMCGKAQLENLYRAWKAATPKRRKK